MFAELAILAVTFGSAAAPPPPPITATVTGVPPGVVVDVVFPASQEPWPADWVLIGCEDQAQESGPPVEVCEYGPPALVLEETAG